MSNKEKSTPPSGKILSFLTRKRDIQTLWLLRVWFHFCSENDGFGRIPAELLVKITKNGVDLREQDAKRRIHLHLCETHMFLERSRKSLSFPSTLQANMQMLKSRFSFNQAEIMVLAFAVCLRNNSLLNHISDCTRPIRDINFAISKILGISPVAIGKALAPGSRLSKSNLIKVGLDGIGQDTLLDAFKLTRESLRVLGRQKLKNTDELLGGFVVTAPAPTLEACDYAHLRPSLAALEKLISDTLRHKRTGVNLLLYGPPGTGKTQLVRVLAYKLDIPLFEIADHEHPMSSRSRDSDFNGPYRLGLTATAQFLLGTRKAILCFDEIDPIFEDGSPLFGKLSTASQKKATVNRMLENNGLPTFWIANSIDGIDPAFARRFDLIIHLDTPPEKQRLQLLERECGSLLTPSQLNHLSKIEHITPALVTRAASVAKRMSPGSTEEPDKIFETILKNTLTAQRHPPIASFARKPVIWEFCPELCNASEDLSRLVSGIARSESCRICLHGPPGTGKTAFGIWLASQLGKPLIMKKASDLQSPFLGEMEQNLARTFEIALRDNAALQIDEVESFLQDRRTAKNSWQISQTNEFLTQMESFDGVLIVSTNLMESIDPAALRRFDHKIKMGYLLPDQAREMLNKLLASLEIPISSSAVSRLTPKNLTPGDFALIARRHRTLPFRDEHEVIAALLRESTAREPATRPIGFLHGGRDEP